MAISTKNKEYIVKMYVNYFGRAAGADTINKYGLKENGKSEKASEILKNIIADAGAEKAGLSTEEFVNNAFQNLFGRDATTKEMNKYSKVVDAGKDLPINSIVKSAAKTDTAVNKNKIEVALKYEQLGGKGNLDLSKISKDSIVDLKTVGNLSDLTNAIEKLADNSGIPNSFDGKTFVLTESVDAGKDFTGTTKNDLFIAENIAGATPKITASAADILDGGKGTDTFKLYDATITAAKLPTLKNIENVALYNLTNGNGDLKKWDTVETLYVENAGAATAGTGFDLGEKVTTVNFENIATNQELNFDKALTAATLGVNNVTAGTGVAVTGAALKTLAVNAYGKESTISNITNAAIETLNITGKANLALTSVAGLGTVKTVDGSKAEGNLTLTNTASMTSIKTGSGNDKVTVNALVASGETIDLGAGNDKLVAGAGGSVAAGSIIDGGAGIDSLDAGLVNAGNVGVFANFETLSLTTNDIDFDITLLNKSTFTTIAIDGAAGAGAGSTVRNVSTSQSLTVNANIAAANTTTLLFKDVAGTADAYKINFNADNTVATNAGIVSVEGIETVTVNSVAKTSVANTIVLKDADAKSLVITGDKALAVTFNTAFGTTGTAVDGKGVSTIDASAATGAVTINTGNVNVAFNGLTIKGGTANDNITLAATGQKATVDAGAGDDIIKTGLDGGTLTGGAGKDKFDVALSLVESGKTTEATSVVKTTITDLTAGDKIQFKDVATETFSKTQVNVSTALNLDQALTAAFTATSAATPTSAIINWFQFAGNTYIVEDLIASGTAPQAGDIVVKINGLVDLSNSSLDGNALLTIA